MDVTFLSTFPNVAIRMKGVKVQQNDPSAPNPLLDADYVDFRFDFWKIWNKEYTIRQVTIRHSSIHLLTTREGKHNFSDLIKEPENTTEKVSFNLDKLVLRDVSIDYKQEGSGSYAGVVEEGLLKIQVDGETTLLESSANLLIYHIKPDGNTYCANTPATIQGMLSFNKEGFEVNSLKCSLYNSSFTAKFLISNNSSQWLLQAESDALASKDLRKVLPSSWVSSLNKYQLDGKFSADLRWEKKLNIAQPTVRLNFTIQDGAMVYPDAKASIDGVFMNGNLKDQKLNGRDIYEVQIDTLVLKLGDHKLYGQMSILDVTNPVIKTQIRGSFPAHAVNPWIGNSQVVMESGNLSIDVQINRNSKGVLSWEGEVGIDSVFMTLQAYNEKAAILSGELLFNNDDAAASGMVIQYKGQTFGGNVLMYNVLNSKSKDLSIQGEISSPRLNLEELLADNGEEKEGVSFGIPPGLMLSLSIKVNELIYKKHRHSQVSLRMYADSSTIAVENLKFAFAGGNVALEALLEKQDANFKFNLHGEFQKVPIDSIFYVQDDFNQSFIGQRHLKGSLTGSLLLSARLDNTMHLILPSLVADVRLSIEEGRLSGFEPMQRLSKFVDEASLADIRFQNLSNDFHIEQGKIFIPEMVIRSNLREITVSGIHGFDNAIDYRLKVPLSPGNKKDPDEVFGAVEADQGKGAFLLLKVTGMGDNPQVAYDKKAVKQKVAERLKEEKRELLQLFKPKIDTLIKKPKTVELEEDVYFDFD